MLYYVVFCFTVRLTTREAPHHVIVTICICYRVRVFCTGSIYSFGRHGDVEARQTYEGCDIGTPDTRAAPRTGRLGGRLRGGEPISVNKHKPTEHNNYGTKVLNRVTHRHYLAEPTGWTKLLTPPLFSTSARGE